MTIRTNIYLSGKVQSEVEYFVRKYNIKPSQVLLLAFKLSDRKQIEQLLQLRLEDLD